MEVLENSVFNLWDTNGRRGDVVNALSIYLNILNKFSADGGYVWKAFPTSIDQYRFYEEAINASPEVFKEHGIFDNFKRIAANEIELALNGNYSSLEALINNDENLHKALEVGIESRARHYTSNLVKFGFVNSKREITKAGKSFLAQDNNRDKLESILPLNIANITILRQLLKLRIYTKLLGNGERKYYSPVLFAFYLLLIKDRWNEDEFRSLVQSISPYQANKDIDSIVKDHSDVSKYGGLKVVVPSLFLTDNFLDFRSFSQFVKNLKSGTTDKIYYDFYKTLFDFKEQKDKVTFAHLIKVYKDNKDKLNKAFGFGINIFDISQANNMFEFLNNNKLNDLLDITSLNRTVYERYAKSKYLDSAREYSDTTKRMLKATGLFRFEKGLVELAYKDVVASMFDLNELKNRIFGECTNNDFLLYEDDENSYYYNNATILDILGKSEEKKTECVNKIKIAYNATEQDLPKTIKKKASEEFIKHIHEKYSKEKVIELMGLFSDRSNDATIQSYVNNEATVPTIFEYITAIAWYYISDEKIDVYECINLTLNSDFEPILFAPGGEGDIVINDDKRAVMLEVTLMDKAAQPKGELEPVLRHSGNLKARNENKEVMTYFVAPELNVNNVATWRMSYYTPYEAVGGKLVKGLIIMCFTNSEICKFLKSNINCEKIYSITKDSFVTKNDIQECWRERIFNSICN